MPGPVLPCWALQCDRNFILLQVFQPMAAACLAILTAVLYCCWLKVRQKDFLCTFMGWSAGRKSNGLDFSDDCTECAQIAAANAVAAASMHSRCKVPPNCVSIQYRKVKIIFFFHELLFPFVEIIRWFVFDLQTCGSSIFMFLIHCSYDFVYFSIKFEKKLSIDNTLEPVWNVPKRIK